MVSSGFIIACTALWVPAVLAFPLSLPVGLPIAGSGQA